MGLDLLDLVFRLEKCFGLRIIRAAPGSRLYDSAFDPPAVGKQMGGARAPQDRWGDQDDGSIPGGISVLSGSQLTAWSSLALTERSHTEYAMRLVPGAPVVVGRCQGLVPPYLDPAYQPTTIVPGTGQAVLHSGGYGQDIRVSRAHFMLLGVSRGIVFVNGVPRRGGGIRPPLNGTQLVTPKGRALSPGEKYLIESGTAMVVRLPNCTELRIGRQVIRLSVRTQGTAQRGRDGRRFDTDLAPLRLPPGGLRPLRGYGGHHGDTSEWGYPGRRSDGTGRLGSRALLHLSGEDAVDSSLRNTPIQRVEFAFFCLTFGLNSHVNRPSQPCLASLAKIPAIQRARDDCRRAGDRRLAGMACS